jgi:hypothetical protein
MATRTASTETTVTENRTTPQDFGPDNGGRNVVAGWQGLVNLFGAQADSLVVNADGAFANGVTFNADSIPDVETLIHDISYRGDKAVTRDLPLYPTYLWLNGETPAPFEDAGEMTLWMSKFFRGAAGENESNRSPQYVKDAITAYKTRLGISTRRGRPPTKISIENLGSIDPLLLAQVPADERAKLEATLARLRGESEIPSA